MKKTKIPNFKSVQEEAKFWDSHDMGDFIDELEITQATFSPIDETKQTMTIRLAPSLKKELDKVAQVYDISTSSLVRMWMVDKLRMWSSTSK